MSRGLSRPYTDRNQAARIADTVREPSASLPPSCTSLPINCVGVACFAALVLFIRYQSNISLPVAAVMCVLAYALPVVVLETMLLKTYRRPSTGLDYSTSRPIAWRRVGVKLAGLYGTIGFIGAAYMLLPEYKAELYHQFWWLLRTFTPVLVIAAIPYFAIVDRYMREPEDGYWHAGRLVLGSWNEVDGAVVRQYLLGWLIKAFFLPLMFAFLTGSITQLTNGTLGHGFSGLYQFSWNAVLAVDVVVGCTGYLFTFRVLDSHIRSSEPTLAGWVAAIVCYPPIWGVIYASYFIYNDNLYWGQWLAGQPVLEVAWGCAIIALTGIYALSTLVFGVRFSNLTHRGVVTSGPYRFTKHPAFVSKNISWWLISVPFVSLIDWDDAVQHCLLLAGVNLIYFLRARTEERHLSRDPVYVEYALAMNRLSVFRGVARLFPALAYRPPVEPVPWPNPPEFQALASRSA